MKKILLSILIVMVISKYSTAQNYFAGTGAGAGNTGSPNNGIGYNTLASGNSGYENVAVGTSALFLNGVGYKNTAIGCSAMYFTTSGHENTAVGGYALYKNTTGGGNAAIGALALCYNTSGYNNTALGERTLISNTTGNENTGIGNHALFNNSTGNNNTATGKSALSGNTTAWNNNAFGYDALNHNSTAWNNNAFGFSSMFSNTVGTENSAFGHDAMYYNDSGSYNCAFGNYALFNNKKGKQNCSFGTYSLGGNTTGISNCSFGYYSLGANNTGDGNAAMGDSSLSKNTSGYNNTGIGRNTLHNNLTGFSNAAFGRNAGALRDSYSKCTLVGVNTDATVTGLTNASAFGFNALVDASNKVKVGNGSITSIGGQVGWTTLSDLRLKENIKESKLGLGFILRLNPVTYNYKDEGQRDIFYTGLIAQEVDAAAKKEGVEFSGVDKNGEYWGIRYGDLTVPIIKGMQEMNKQNEEFERLENQNKEILLQLAQMQECLQSLCSNQQKLNLSIDASAIQMNIAPNPTNDVAKITIISPDKNQSLILKITDASGKLIHTETVKGNSVYDFNTSSLSKGNYLFQLFNQKEIIQSQKLIVQ